MDTTTPISNNGSHSIHQPPLDHQSISDQQANRLLNLRLKLIDTLCSSQHHGHLILAVTLTPAVSVSESVARSQSFRSLWDSTLLRQVTRRIPIQHEIGHVSDSYSIELKRFEKSHQTTDLVFTNGLWHFHGVLVIHNDHRDRFWKNGALHKAFERDLRSLHGKGKYHSYPIRSICVEILAANESERLPHRDTYGLPAIESWINYASKPWCWKAKSIWQED